MFPLKIAAAKEKTAFVFLSKLLILLCALKCAFFFYNYRITNGWSLLNISDAGLIIKWSLLYDAVCIALVNLPLFFFISVAGNFLHNKYVKVFVTTLFTFLNTLLIFLNSVDIFYYRFHLQRADADMLYVLRNPFDNGTANVFLVVVGSSILLLWLSWLIFKSIFKLLETATPVNHFLLTNSLLIVFLLLFYFSGSKKLVPTYPLTELEPTQLPLAQNSLHSFIYSLYRKNETTIPAINYMSTAQQESLFSIHKKNNTGASSPKNIVLFIMESVPADFFDSASPYKVTMPFLDSIVNKSTYFNNAFSFSYSSNKGITALLTGLPTITDIPLYHSNFTSINRTSVGTELAKKNYSSAFFIGDNYDDFGFAQCSKWLGIQQYYCMQNIPGYQQMEKHSMGLHDEYVLHFMQEKLRYMKQPFFAVQYNISTHYPNDLPKTFTDSYPGRNTTPPMKSMQYYNNCLEQFFKTAATQPWFNNTVFIFCADHWAQPDTRNIRIDEVESFRIPLFIYDPADEKKIRISSPVSQLDIINTILYFGNVNDSFVSYGVNLRDTMLQPHRIVFTKLNNALYQAINDEYVLGFNPTEGKTVYCYDYKNDPEKKNNLLLRPTLPKVDSIILNMKAFLQTASNHYRKRGKNGL